jgi:hypothetical protein
VVSDRVSGERYYSQNPKVSSWRESSFLVEVGVASQATADNVCHASRPHTERPC